MHSGEFTFTSKISQHDNWACLDKGMQTSKHSKEQHITNKGVQYTHFILDENTRVFLLIPTNMYTM